ncbi:MAG: inner membrane CreD family protein [candidate division Zixibacteria bacterium]|jgi:hypothetical protein|nr:inner membrane CreD family protein [candidate division Zixibacteria bacterium]
MVKRIIALAFIFGCTTVAWAILGTSTVIRTESQDDKLAQRVSKLWGQSQWQHAPDLTFKTEEERLVDWMVDGRPQQQRRVVAVDKPQVLDSSTIAVSLQLDHRKKGLLWYSTYRVEFDGSYLVSNPGGQDREYTFTYRFPARDGIYDNFMLSVDGNEVRDLQPVDGAVSREIRLAPGEQARVRVSYGSQGLDEWWYVFGTNVAQVRNLSLTMYTDFGDIDFPDDAISPTSKEKTEDGWKLTWAYGNLISGVQIGMVMPKKLNPGPFVSRVSFFAPVSLFLFLFLMFMITTLRDIKIHPMNYFFVSAAFFAFHLLLAYLADHVDIHIAFAISAVVSILLVISYMRLVVGTRFALVETGLAQLVYLVAFSYAFFLEGYTGLTITVLCIVTLFVMMQLTGRINWEEKFASIKSGDSRPARSLGGLRDKGD